MPRLLITGSLAYDYILHYPGLLQHSLAVLQERDQCNLTLQAQSYGRYFGGCGGNIAYTLALLGEHPRLLSIAGSDVSAYREHLQAAGVDLSSIQTVPDRLTATCVILNDSAQNRVIGFYGGATDLASQLDLKAALDPSIGGCIVAPDDGPAMLAFAQSCREVELPFLFDFGSQASSLNADELRQGVQGCRGVFCNEYEMSVFQTKTGWTLPQLLENVPMAAVTRGEAGSVLYARDRTPLEVPAVPLYRDAVESTGAGDAYRAGFGMGWMRGLDWETCARLGSTTAAFVLESQGTQSHKFTKNDLIFRCEEQFGPLPAFH